MLLTFHLVKIPFSRAEALVTVWSGLRGYVGLTLSLYILADVTIKDEAYRFQAF